MSENGGNVRCNGLCTFSAGGSHYDATCPEHGHLAAEAHAPDLPDDPGIRYVFISETSADVLLQICRQSTAHDAKGKIAIGTAQMELEEGLAKLHPPEKPIVIPRAERRRRVRASATV